MNESLDGIILAAIAAGGVLGAWLRWTLLRIAARIPVGGRQGIDPGHATLAANLLACGLLGGLVSTPWLAAVSSEAARAALPAFAITGVCGSLSTFSTLCADATGQARRGSRGRAALYLLAHVVGGPLAFWSGSLLGR